ncbi:hypothetical protein [Actinomadura verrucosospora]|uniref:Uncharacterized protein n=1 Tax=Actinomadura verrucosospora TaxID=46165 RepID=A0A7D4AC75_ACTVE|nr:hypothetical protein [Actinomadura verrucosospora]QKG27505.1 hypothetical protein ACTIVE_9160 [Actinomadura verrucosospora]
MTSLMKGVLRGIAAGAAGTTALNATTEADMAIRGRPASDVPATVAGTLADLAGARVPGDARERGDRLDGLGALGGTFTGLAVGALAGALRAAGIRLPAVIGGPLLGAAAMAAADLPIVRLGISDPRTWTRADWVSDAVPHLLYGMTTHAVLAAQFRADEERKAQRQPRPDRPSRRALMRAAALGAAAGCRSSAGLSALALRSRRYHPGLSGRLSHPAVKAVNGLLTMAEMGLDKLPSAPPRTSPQGLAPRVAIAAVTARAVARRDGIRSGPPVLLAAAAATASAAAGVRLREAAADRMGSDLPGALAEDAAAALLGQVGAAR